MSDVYAVTWSHRGDRSDSQGPEIPIGTEVPGLGMIERNVDPDTFCCHLYVMERVILACDLLVYGASALSRVFQID